MTVQEAKRLRVGTKVKFSPNPASLALYRDPPARGALGTVVAIPVGGGARKTFLPGPGGGLVYVEWNITGVCGVSSIDIEKGW